MSTLASGHVLRGAQWNYRVLDALGGDGTHTSAAFKAEILPKDAALDARPPRWFAMLHPASAISPQLANPLNQGFYQVSHAKHSTCQENLRHECESYLLHGVASSPCFRKMYDMIGDHMSIDSNNGGSIPCVAFEWLETTLGEVEYRPSIRNYAIIKETIRTVLRCCIVLANQDLVNTGTTSDVKGQY
jgi:hypothetical protein